MVSSFSWVTADDSGRRGFRPHWRSLPSARDFLPLYVAGGLMPMAAGRPVDQSQRGNCSGSRGRPHCSPLPGSIFIVIRSPSPYCRGGNTAAPFVTYCRSRHPRRSGDPEPLSSSTQLENGVLPQIPPRVIVALTVFAHSQGSGSPLRRGGRGIGAFPENVAVWSGKVGFLQAFAQITPLFHPFFVASGAVPDTNFFSNSVICCHLLPFSSGGVREMAACVITLRPGG